MMWSQSTRPCCWSDSWAGWISPVYVKTSGQDNCHGRLWEEVGNARALSLSPKSTFVLSDNAEGMIICVSVVLENHAATHRTSITGHQASNASLIIQFYTRQIWSLGDGLREDPVSVTSPASSVTGLWHWEAAMNQTWGQTVRMFHVFSPSIVRMQDVFHGVYGGVSAYSLHWSSMPWQV